MTFKLLRIVGINATVAHYDLEVSEVALFVNDSPVKLDLFGPADRRAIDEVAPGAEIDQRWDVDSAFLFVLFHYTVIVFDFCVESVRTIDILYSAFDSYLGSGECEPVSGSLSIRKHQGRAVNPEFTPLEADIVGEGDREGCFGYSFVDAAVLDYDLGFRFLEVDHHGAGGIELYVGGRNYRPVKVGLSAEFGSYHTLFDQDSDFESAVLRIFDECEVFVGEDGFVDSERYLKFGRVRDKQIAYQQTGFVTLETRIAWIFTFAWQTLEIWIGILDQVAIQYIPVLDSTVHAAEGAAFGCEEKNNEVVLFSDIHERHKIRKLYDDRFGRLGLCSEDVLGY